MARSEPADDGNSGAIDAALALALRGARAGWPLAARGDGEVARVLERVRYHGMAGLLAARPDALADWPASAREGLHEEALAAAMWDARHRSIVVPLLEALAGAGIVALVLKGTALAHDLYDHPAERIRADTDLLIAAGDLPRAREILRASGFALDPTESAMPEALRLQELWERPPVDGGVHQIDLHVDLFNAPALRNAMLGADLFAHAVPLPWLCPSARTLDRAAMLLHLAMHRAVHRVSPYFIGGRSYRGGDRLIWLVDIARVAQSLDDADRERLAGLAERAGAVTVCREAVDTARALLGVRISPAVFDVLSRDDGRGATSAYLLRAGGAARAWRNLCAMPGAGAKASYLVARVFPPAVFMRARYPELTRWPLPIVHLRRIWGLLRGR